MNALVDATPISGPAWVGSSRSASRAIELVGTLTTTAMRCCCARAWRSAAKRVRRLAGLADEQRQPARLQHRLAVPELARDIDVDRYARELLDPIFGDQPGIVTGAAGDDGEPIDGFEVGLGDGQRDLALERANVALESLGDHDRLLENLLLHVVRVIALLDRR